MSDENVKMFPAPRRFLVEMDTETDDNYTIEVPRLIEVTGKEDLVYIEGRESPWLGFSLEQIEKWAFKGEYGEFTGKLFEQIIWAREGQTFFEKEEK